jgi:hypothetical protein
MLLSFERPARRRQLAGPRSRAPRGALRLFADLENYTVANVTGITGREPQGSFPRESRKAFPDHRQDSKGTWWMPWHQESMKGVNGCDKPR